MLKALYQFRWHLEPKGNQTTGKHFNHHLLDETAQLYEKNSEKFDYVDSPKNEFYWKKVFGGVERLVPACDAQSIAHGVCSLFNEGKKSSRVLDFTYGGGKYYPLTLHPDWEIGYNCCGGRGGMVRTGPWGWAERVSTLMSSKNNNARSYPAAWTIDTCGAQRDKVIARR